MPEQAAVSSASQNIRKGSLYVIGAALCWSLGGVLVKLIPWNAMAINGLRSLVALIVTVLVSRQCRIRFTRTNILGACCLCGTAFLYIFATKLTTAANAIVLQYTAPVFIVIISTLFLRKRATRVDLLGVVVIFCGIVLFFFDDLSGGQLLGNLLALASGLCFSGMFLVNSAEGATPIQATLLGHILGALIGIPFAVTGVTADPIPWLAVIAMGVIQLGLAYVLLAKGSPLVPPLLASLLSCIEPVLNPLWVLLAIGERPGPWALAGIVIVLAGVVLYNVLISHKSRHQPAESPPVQDAEEPEALQLQKDCPVRHESE